MFRNWFDYVFDILHTCNMLINNILNGLPVSPIYYQGNQIMMELAGAKICTLGIRHQPTSTSDVTNFNPRGSKYMHYSESICIRH